MCVCVFFSFFISWLCFLPWTKVSFFCTPSPLVYSSITLLFILPLLFLSTSLSLSVYRVSAKVSTPSIYPPYDTENYLHCPSRIPFKLAAASGTDPPTNRYRQRSTTCTTRCQTGAGTCWVYHEGPPAKKSARASDDLLISVLQMYRNYQPHC